MRTVRNSKKWFIILLTVAVILLASLSVWANTDEDYATVANYLATPFYSDGAYTRTYSLDKEYDRCRNALKGLELLRTDDSKLRVIQREASSEFKTAVLLLEGIYRIDRKKPSNWEMLIDGNVLIDEEASGWDKLGALLDFLARMAAEGEKTELQKQYREAIRKLRVRSFDLIDIARENGGPSISPTKGGTEKPLLDVNLDSSWNGLFNQDYLYLSNTSGKPMTKATIIVDLKDKNDRTQSHVHYVDYWEKGATYFGKYSQGSVYDHYQTLTDIQRAEIRVYCKEFSQEFTYHYTKAWRDVDIEKYCDDLNFTGSILNPYDNWFGQGYRGVRISFKGLDYLKPSAVVVTLRNGDWSESRRWINIGKWKGGSHFWRGEDFRSSHFTYHPTSYTVKIYFPDSDYVHTANWTVD